MKGTSIYWVQPHGAPVLDVDVTLCGLLASFTYFCPHFLPWDLADWLLFQIPELGCWTTTNILFKTVSCNLVQLLSNPALFSLNVLHSSMSLQKCRVQLLIQLEPSNISLTHAELSQQLLPCSGVVLSSSGQKDSRKMDFYCKAVLLPIFTNPSLTLIGSHRQNEDNYTNTERNHQMWKLSQVSESMDICMLFPSTHFPELQIPQSTVLLELPPDPSINLNGVLFWKAHCSWKRGLITVLHVFK